MMKSSQRGVAMILALIVLVVISVMAISLTFIARTETWSSMNYRLMSQARNAAEAGVNTTANYLMGATFSPLPTNYYTPPTPTSTTDPFSNYNINAYPVQNGATNTTGNDVVLSASSTSSNYPITSVQSAFNATGIGKDSFRAGNTTVSYTTSARLLAMQNLSKVPPFTNTDTTLQTWEITSTGTISGVQTASEQVTAILDRSAMSAYAYAAFATSNGCNALKFGGGGTTDSYASGAPLSGGIPVTTASDGNVGTNGNLDTIGNTTVINGNLSTPRAGIGTCSSGNVTAWTNSCSPNQNPCTQLDGSIVELPQPVTYPTPTIGAPGTTDLRTNDNSCGTLSYCVVNTYTTTTTGNNGNGNGNGNGNTITTTLTEIHLSTPSSTGASPNNSIQNLRLDGNTTTYLGPGIYDINSLVEQGSSTLAVETAASCATLPTTPVNLQASCVPVDAAHPVILEVTGTGYSTPIDLTGGGVVNGATTLINGVATPSYDPTTLQIFYAGSGAVSLKGGANAVATVYAPNASYSFNSAGGNWYGAVIGATMTDMGGATLNYDRKLKDKKYIPGPFMLSNFTWNKY